MPQWKLEQRGRIVWHSGETELETCRAALRALDEKHGVTPTLKRPRNPDFVPPAVNILGLMAE
ncbi:MAG: hypothetical protein CVT60_05625 [Actinobacteria bacterium HGW-Actinobacteria-10]|nr:MAG: hypothetical protein CVT60_05625 [Actinobacteria bacterium HGW-Actinobacteria-10]